MAGKDQIVVRSCSVAISTVTDSQLFLEIGLMSNKADVRLANPHGAEDRAVRRAWHSNGFSSEHTSQCKHPPQVWPSLMV